MTVDEKDAVRLDLEDEPPPTLRARIVVEQQALDAAPRILPEPRLQCDGNKQNTLWKNTD